MFVTERCKLRPFEEKDLDALMAYRNNDEWMRYQGFKNLTKDEYRERLLVPLNVERGIQLAIAEIASDNLLGDLYLVKDDKSVTIGYSINPIHSRQGYITELLKAFLPKLKSYYSGYEVIAMTDKDNVPSKNLLLKLGFEYDQWIEEWESEVYIFRTTEVFEGVDFEDLQELLK